MKKPIKLETLKQGQYFKYDERLEFVKLDNSHGGCLCLATDVWFNARFDENDKNNWEISSLRKELTARIGEFIPIDNLIPFDRDLTTDDGLTEYGTCTDIVSLLTCDEYRRYRKLIPNCGKSHWTITADSLEYSCVVRFVSSGGSLDYYGACYGAEGVRPLCVLKSDTIVEVKDSGSHVNCTDKLKKKKRNQSGKNRCFNKIEGENSKI